MGLIQKTVKRLVPRGFFGSKVRAVLDAIGESLQDAYDYIAAVLTESNPGTADSTLAEWYATLGLRYDATLDLDTRQAIAQQAYISIGGQSLNSLNTAVQVAFPDVVIVAVRFSTLNMVGVGMVGRMVVTDYPSWYGGATDGSYPVAYYRVTGEVNDAAERTALLNLLDRIAPAEMEPVTGALVIRNQTETAEVGLAMAGLAEVGKTKED